MVIFGWYTLVLSLETKVTTTCVSPSRMCLSRRYEL